MTWSPGTAPAASGSVAGHVTPAPTDTGSILERESAECNILVHDDYLVKLNFNFQLSLKTL